jgi:hypothetical protein
MAGNLLPALLFQAFSPNGGFLSGGLLYSYQAGTSIPYPVYQDPGLTTPWPNPLTLNSLGQALIYLNPGQAIKVNVTDSQGNQLPGYPVDQISGALNFPSIAGSLIPSQNKIYTVGSTSFQWIAGYFGTVYQGGIPVVSYPQTVAESNADVTPINYQYPPGYPERYTIQPSTGFIYVTGGSVPPAGYTDFAPGIQTALNCQGQPCILGAFNYGCSAVFTMPNEQKWSGQGLNETGVCFAFTAVGNMVNPNGVAASKIEIRGITFYGNTVATLTGGIVIGTNPQPYGTEGFIDQVMVRDLPALALAFDIYCNIGEFGNIYALNTAGIRLQGNFQVTAIENTNASGFVDISGHNSCTQLQDGWVGFFECEAPQTGLFLLTVQGQLEIDYFLPSLALSTAFTQLVYLTSSATGWKINIPQYYFGGISGTFPTFTNLFFEQSTGAGFGAGSTSTSATSHAGAGLYQSGITTQGTQFAVKKQQLNNFSIQIANNSATIQHKIFAAGQTGVAPTWASSVSGDSTSYTNTPTGTDATTAFAAGAKISSTDNYLLVINSGAEVPSDAILFATITLNTTTTATYQVRPTVINLDINGVTQNWLAFWLTNAATGANVSWATALATNAYSLEITFLGFIY